MPNSLRVNNWPKLFAMLVINGFVAMYFVTGNITFSEASLIHLPTLTYLLGNGIAAKREEPSTPVLGVSDNGNRSSNGV